MLDLVQGRVLDPSTALTVKGVTPRSTVYVGPRLLVSRGPTDEASIRTLEGVAEGLGWSVTVSRPQGVGDPGREGPGHLRDHGLGTAQPARRRALLRRRRRERRGRGRPAGPRRLPTTGPRSPPTAGPCCRTHGPRPRTSPSSGTSGSTTSCSLRGIGANPYEEGHPYDEGHPYEEGHSAVGTYGSRGSGGRQPVMYVGPRPPRSTTVKGRRPVVATLDTGCGVHPWLTGVVRTDVTLDTDPIGYVDPATDPERWPDQVGPLDGGIDGLAGHGTFIAGLVHQACPDADIVALRIIGSEGPIVESDLVRRSRTSGARPPSPGRRAAAVTRSTCSACRWATTTRRPRTSCSTPRCPTS